MKELLLPAINLVPGITIIIVIAYFYSQKKRPELIWMLLASIVTTLTTAFSMYAPYYFRDRFSSMAEMSHVFEIVGIISIIAHFVFAIALAIVLSKYPDRNKDSYTQFS